MIIPKGDEAAKVKGPVKVPAGVPAGPPPVTPGIRPDSFEGHAPPAQTEEQRLQAAVSAAKAAHEGEGAA